MNFKKMAQAAVANVQLNDPVAVADATVVFRNEDGTYSVCDNGEEVDGLNAAQAIDIIVENLEAGA